MLKNVNKEFHCSGCGQLLFRYRVERDEKNTCNTLVFEVKCKDKDCFSPNKFSFPLELDIVS